MKTIQGDGFTVGVIKSRRRKTVALKITEKGASIYIPHRLSMEIAQQFIEQKTSWIQQKLQQQSRQQKIERQFTNGEVFNYLGEPHTLQLSQQDRIAVVNKIGNELILSGRLNRLSTTGIRLALIQWYKDRAIDYLTMRTTELAEQTGLKPKSITIKSYKARWGSCTIHAELHYNWQLIQAPAEIIDYVIIHELCHIQHHNHSRQFWQLVEQHYPNYKTARHWLKIQGYQLVF